MTFVLSNPKIETTVVFLVENLIHRNIDNSNRNEMKQKGMFRNIGTIEASELYNRNSDQDDNEIQIAVVLAPFRHDHKLPSFLPALLLFLVFAPSIYHTYALHPEPTYLLDIPVRW